MKCATIVEDLEQSSHSQIVRSLSSGPAVGPPVPRPPDAPSGRTILGTATSGNSMVDINNGLKSTNTLFPCL